MNTPRLAATLLASAALALCPAAAASASSPGALFHISGATVTTDWSYDLHGVDGDGTPFEDTGSETSSMAMTQVDRSADSIGIYTARLGGSANGTYNSSDAYGPIANCTYGFNPAAIHEQVQLNVVPLSGHRFEVNSSLGPGEDAAAVSELQNELLAAQSACNGYSPVNLGYGLTFDPAPNNVHTRQCQGIGEGCEIFSRNAFRGRSVTVKIATSGPVSAEFLPPGDTGTATYTSSIDVVLKRG